MITRKNSQKLLISAFALVIVSGLGFNQAFAQSTTDVTFTIDFETGVYSIVPGADPFLEAKYVEDAFVFETPVAPGQHFDSGPNAINTPYLSFHEEGINTVDNVIMSALGGASFDLLSFDLVNDGTGPQTCVNPQLRLSASDGSEFIIPSGTFGPFVVGFNNVLWVSFDIIEPGSTNELFCIDNFVFDDEPVGGELLSIDTTALLLAGAQTNAAWLLSALAVIGSVAFGALYITSKKN